MTLFVGYAPVIECDNCGGCGYDPDDTYRECGDCDGNGVIEHIDYDLEED